MLLLARLKPCPLKTNASFGTAEAVPLQSKCFFWHGSNRAPSKQMLLLALLQPCAFKANASFGTAPTVRLQNK
jgi:hypothetical protein